MCGATITLVSHLVARVGYTFMFTGPSQECLNCRFRKVCVDKLRRGHAYRIVKVLGIRNKCPINKYVVTVAVEEASVPAAIPKRYGVEGLIFSYSKINCRESKCENYGLCRPSLLPERAKVKVVRIYKQSKLVCPKGLSLVKAELIVL